MSARGFRAWAPIVLWAAVIFAFSSIPSLSSGLGTWDLILRKIAHLSEYAILGALLLRAIQRPAVAILAGGLYAVTDEVHQHFVRGRHAAWYDVADRHGRRRDRRARLEPPPARHEIASAQEASL